MTPSVESQDQTFNCLVCGQSFDSEIELEKHNAKMHPENKENKQAEMDQSDASMGEAKTYKAQ